MNFTLSKSFEILERTPDVLYHMLSSISLEWTSNNEGEGTWTVFDVIGHLIYGDRSDWIERTEIILSDRENKLFEPFDRFAQFELNKGKTLDQLLKEFKEVRQVNMMKLRSFKISDGDLLKTGIHPNFGEVTLSQLLATWVAHDLDHISQISRVMAKQYRDEVGPWIEFLRIMK